MRNEEWIDVLLVEDEQTLAMIIKDTLEGQGFRIRLAKDGEEGLQCFFHMDGFEMVRRIRRSDAVTPVLFLTARSAVNDVVEGFELGANDYLKKPFGMQELIVRIKALAGRVLSPTQPPRAQALFEIGDYVFTPRTQQLLHQGTTAELSHRESEILRRLCERRDQVVEMRDILLELWGDDSFFNQRSLHVFITKLRHKLNRDKRVRIVNVRGIGYKLIVS